MALKLWPSFYCLRSSTANKARPKLYISVFPNSHFNDNPFKQLPVDYYGLLTRRFKTSLIRQLGPWDPSPMANIVWLDIQRYSKESFVPGQQYKWLLVLGCSSRILFIWCAPRKQSGLKTKMLLDHLLKIFSIFRERMSLITRKTNFCCSL